MSYKILPIAAAGLALAACSNSMAHRTIGSTDPAMGEAVKYNAAVQTINPDPVYAPGGAQPGDNGEKGANAVKRYRSDQVKQTEAIATTGGSGTGPR